MSKPDSKVQNGIATTTSIFYKKGAKRQFFSLSAFKKYEKQQLVTYCKENIVQILFTVLLLPVYHFFRSYKQLESKQTPLDQETELKFMELIGKLQNREFFLADSFAPLPLYLYNYLFNKHFLDHSVIRLFNLVLSCGVLMNVGIISTVLHRVLPIITYCIQYYLFQSETFQYESVHISMDMLQLFAITFTVMTFVTYKKIGGFHIWLLACLSLGVTISIKKIGLITFSWIVLLYLYEFFVQILADLTISKSAVWFYHFFIKFMTLIVIPMAILVTPYHQVLNRFDPSVNKSNDYSLMTPSFKNSFPQLKDRTLKTLKFVNYNDTVLIRHTESMGGYLHSHPVNYKTGSHQQQVTLFDYPDLNNEWQIVPARIEDRQNLNSSIVAKSLVKRAQHVLLKHKQTGKFLYVSKNDKPPVNEKDKAFELSCREWDEDELASFKFAIYFHQNTDYNNLTHPDGNFIEQKDYDNALLTMDSDVSLSSTAVGGCMVISHEDRLPAWGFFQQEVMCMQGANSGRTSFYIETVIDSDSHLGTYHNTVPKLTLRGLVQEYIQKSLKKDLVVRLTEVDIRPATVLKSISLWIIPAGFEELDYFKIAQCVSLLLLLVVSPMIMLFQMFKWNPISDDFENTDMNIDKYHFSEYNVVYSLGWFLHFFIFHFSKHPILFTKQALPSVVLLLLQNAVLLQYLYTSIRGKLIAP